MDWETVNIIVSVFIFLLIIWATDVIFKRKK
ncbi:hypothetical protein EPNKCIFM_00211 [Klebsiella phage KP13-16]|nr:hypothetical protein EPNKCIFM_00211 [Klebsiella phage KP13-16]